MITHSKGESDSDPKDQPEPELRVVGSKVLRRKVQEQRFDGVRRAFGVVGQL
jgi:hypothetical protein